MKTAAGVSINASAKTAAKPALSLFAKIAKFVDDLVVRYYYKGERLRPEVRERLEKSVEEAERGENLSPRFTNTEDAIKWLKS